MQLAIEIAIIVILLGLNAFLAASEIAIISARKPRLRALADDGNRAAARVLDLGENPSGFLATVQVGITLAGFFASAVGAMSIAEYAARLLEPVPIDFVERHASAIAVIVVTVILASLNIIVGELVPKTLAVERAEWIALRTVRPIELLATGARPVVWFLTTVTNLILRSFGSQGRASLPGVTQAEILALLETAEDEGVVEAGEAELVEEALDFGNILVRNVMVPRVDVEAIDAESPLNDSIARFFETGYSRLPVYRGTPDNVLGILHVKDAYRLAWNDPATATKPVAEFVRPAYFIPESKPINELLAELRARRTHVAIVIDEYGGMAGLVTLEDLLEELVGDIADEFDAGYEPYREVESGIYDVDGRVSILDLLDVLDLDRDELDPGDAESVGGLIADGLGRIPEQGDVVETGPVRLEVRSMDGFRVAIARVERMLEDDRDSEDEAEAP